MKAQTDVVALVRARSPLPPDETERLVGGAFMTSRAVQFVCRHYFADRLSVLDIGCAQGQHLVHFGRGSAGIDAIASNVEFARALGLDAVVANVEDGLPDLGRRFQAVFSSNLLEHLVAPHLFLLRLHDVLEPTGLVFIHVPTTPPLPVVDRIIKRGIGHNGYLASEHLYAWTPRTLGFLLERAGFRLLDTAFVAVRDHKLLRFAESVLVQLGISVCAVARRDPNFIYPDKRVRIFTPAFAQGSDRR
ncbi:MAG: methyltransferase domain-containing protein [Chloroflexi bacterium]|nr:methyltransferase domain-containing protein [Chloroflexota bacterium]